MSWTLGWVVGLNEIVTRLNTSWSLSSSWSFTTFSVGWLGVLDEIKAISAFNQDEVEVEAELGNELYLCEAKLLKDGMKLIIKTRI